MIYNTSSIDQAVIDALQKSSCNKLIVTGLKGYDDDGDVIEGCFNDESAVNMLQYCREVYNGTQFDFRVLLPSETAIKLGSVGVMLLDEATGK